MRSASSRSGDDEVGALDDAVLLGAGVAGLVLIGGVSVTAGAEADVTVDGCGVPGLAGLLDAEQAPRVSRLISPNALAATR